MKYILKIFLSLFLVTSAYAVNPDIIDTHETKMTTTPELVTTFPMQNQNETSDDDIIPVSELLYRENDNTKCATAVFANALQINMTGISEDATENELRRIIQNTFTQSDVLTQVLQCPEFQDVADDAPIKFLPVEYTFKNGRKITINYETQPKILKQHLLMANKRGLPSDPNPSPRVGDPNDPTLWTNTDPAWYAILVVEKGTLDEFIGPEKNNTISLKYIKDNIETLRPQGTCTNESAFAYDGRNLNVAVHKTVGMGDEDSNDYYVAGDVNLQWIGYAEIAIEVIITIATWGGGAALSAFAKSIKASRLGKRLVKTMKILRKSDKVSDYIRLSNRVSKAEKELDAVKAFKKIDQLNDAIRSMDKVKDAKKIAKYEKEIKELQKSTKGFKNGKSLRTTSQLEKDIAEGKKTLKHMETAEKDVSQYKQASETFAKLQKYRHDLRLLRTPHRGNILARAFKFVKTATGTGGEKTLSAAAKLGRSSSWSGRIRDSLFITTLNGMDKLGKMERQGALLYGAMRFAGDMFDWTEASTGEFTNDIEFQPLGLLSADDIPGQENVVNYGMWLMWQGDSYSAADDDAAYLQAMDFAAKFHSDLEDVQKSKNDYSCNIDIYVVRPIIREPGSDNPEMYYLIMNDEPFRTNVPDGTTPKQPETMSDLQNDLQIVTQCKQNGVALDACLEMLQGSY